MDNLLLLKCAAGIIGALAIYGYLQERIMAMPYGAEDEFFKDTVFLVLNNRIVAGLAGFTMVFVKGESFTNGPPVWKYFIIAVSNIAATYCQYEALKYVSFPTQTLGKTMKMVPVMVMGRILSGKTYPRVQWAISFTVTVGIMLFLLTGSISSKRSKGGGADSLYGMFLILAYLAFDSFTPVLQEKLWSGQKASKNAGMFFTNLSSAIMSIAYLTYAGTLKDAISFSTRHPSFVADATILSLAGSANQFAIYATVSNFGALMLAVIMNIRQMVQVIVSMVVYKHLPTAGQVAGLVIVFSALFYKVRIDQQKKAAKDAEKQAEKAK